MTDPRHQFAALVIALTKAAHDPACAQSLAGVIRAADFRVGLDDATPEALKVLYGCIARSGLDYPSAFPLPLAALVTPTSAGVSVANPHNWLSVISGRLGPLHGALDRGGGGVGGGGVSGAGDGRVQTGSRVGTCGRRRPGADGRGEWRWLRTDDRISTRSPATTSGTMASWR